MKIKEVKALAQGQWLRLLGHFKVAVPDAGRHGPCPICGGKDRFRLDDRDGHGTWYCNQCEPQAGDGIALLMKAKSWSCLQTVREVAALLATFPPAPVRKDPKMLPMVRTSPPDGTVGHDLFIYQTSDGTPVIYVKRIERTGGKKTFRQWGPTLDGTGWQPNLNNVPRPRPLYRLPQILADSTLDVIVHEGESSVEAAVKANLPGLHITSIGGAKNAHHSDWSPLMGRQVFICPDHDDDGEHYAEDVTRGAQKAGATSVRLVRLPNLSAKGDVVDWLAAGGTPEQFTQLLADAKSIENTGPTGPTGPIGPPPLPERSDADGRVVPSNGPGYSGPVRFPDVPGYRTTKEGVWELALKEDKDDIRITTAPCWVTAHGRDPEGEAWSATVRWIDRDGRQHERTVPMSRFHEVGSRLAGELADGGLPVIPGKERKLLQYLARGNPATRTRTALHTGWQDGDETFVLPTETLGDESTGERTIFQNPGTVSNEHGARPKGTLKEWQQHVAAPCERNRTLAFFLCSALSAPLLKPMGLEGGGFHLYGQTSQGKTTTLQVAASVFGDGTDPAEGPAAPYLRKWNATKNATEGLAEAHMDLPLCMDEVGEADTREFGRTIYQLGGGQGKARMGKDTSVGRPKAWRCLILSSGELSAADVIESGGSPVKGGQAVRLIDVPAADPITGEGIVVETQGDADTGTFIDRLKRACGTYFGTAGPAFIDALIQRGLPKARDEAQALLAQIGGKLVPSEASAEVRRAARRFALVGVAGETAIKVGILPWKVGTAIEVVRLMFQRYVLARGGVGSHAEQSLQSVRDFLLAHGSSRFRLCSADEDVRINNLAGYRDPDKEQFYLTSQGFKEACGGHDVRETARLLLARGLLHTTEPSRHSTLVYIPGMGRIRVYAISMAILDEGSNDLFGISAGDRSQA